MNLQLPMPRGTMRARARLNRSVCGVACIAPLLMLLGCGGNGADGFPDSGSQTGSDGDGSLPVVDAATPVPGDSPFLTTAR
jgi:hypothetical protein